MKIFRKEHFGGILYDTENLRFNLVSKNMSFNANRIIERKLPKRTDILSSPVRVYFEITQKCNLNCKHCFVSSSNKKNHGASTSTLLGILDELENNGIIDVRFTGGEPTIRPDWFDILKYAKSLDFVVSINTNGVYEKPDEIILKLAELNLEQVTVSLDGIERNHDYIRGRGSFKKTMESIKLMKEKGLLNNPFYHHFYSGEERKETILELPDFPKDKLMEKYYEFRKIFG